MITHEQYLALRRFPGLDGVRAIAALLVIVFHYGGPLWDDANGWIGVSMFFVLSGFLITTLALREEDRNGKVSLADFYIRRVFRIVPVYYAVLAIVVAVAYLRGAFHATQLASLVNYLTFTNEYNNAISTYGQAWSLGVEQKFYLLWPLLAFGLAALTFAKRLTLAIGLIAVMIALAPVMPFASAYVPILIGCTLAILLHYRRGFAVLRLFTHPVSGIVVAAAVVVVQIHVRDLEAFFGDGGITGNTIYALLVALLVPSLIAGGPLSRLLSLAPMRFIGERSYSLYLLQGVAAVFITETIPQLEAPRTLTAIATAILALAIADVLYRWVELPMIEVGRKIVKRRGERLARRAAPAEKPVPAAIAVPAKG